MSTVEHPSASPPSGSVDHSFNENSPRPPIPGEETEVPTGSQSPLPYSYSSWGSVHKYNKGGSSPVLTPRRSSLAYNTSNVSDASAPLGFEPEGSCGDGNGGGTVFLEGGSRSPPPYLRWACNLHSLLEDPEGVELFRRYLDHEGRVHADTLDFWFACEGLKKQQDPDRINQLVKVIFSTKQWVRHQYFQNALLLRARARSFFPRLYVMMKMFPICMRQFKL